MNTFVLINKYNLINVLHVKFDFLHIGIEGNNIAL